MIHGGVGKFVFVYLPTCLPACPSACKCATFELVHLGRGRCSLYRDVPRMVYHKRPICVVGRRPRREKLSKHASRTAIRRRL